jgi:hypothetical protein
MIIGDAHSVTPAQALDKARKLHAEVELGGIRRATRRSAGRRTRRSWARWLRTTSK